MTFNPFDKQIDNLNMSDLDILINEEISEGYWIEYKSEFQSNKKIAKSISSFANTYGGWYFIGIQADTTKNVASDICGFNMIDDHDPISRIREVVKNHIDPVPLFFTKLLEQKSERGVLVVYIPDNQETPFINKDGRIYRRISDSSDPIPEINRHAVDRLVENGKDVSRGFEDFCKVNRAIDITDKEKSWISIFLYPYPLGLINRFDMISNDGMEQLLNLSREPLRSKIINGEDFEIGSVPFHSSQLGILSIILRQVKETNLAINSLSMEFYSDGRSKICFPLEILNIMDEDKNNNIIRRIMSALNMDSFADITENQNALYLNFFNIHKSLTAIMLLLLFYEKWFENDLIYSQIRYAIKIENISHTIPFFIHDEWVIHVKKFGLPIQHVDSINIPSNIGRGVIHNLENPLWHIICPSIFLAFGLPISLYTKTVLNTPIE